ncbi:flagellar motor switch protein FliN [Euzebya sp.]|uniref:flagellar motor switch protein FliN n=1 Tax=Euzebya sp. TaxID=1971409 RepID=UPI003512D058
MSESLLHETAQAVARRIGDRLPAAFAMDAGEVVVSSDPDAHALPADAVAVRFELGPDAALVIALTADTAEALASQESAASAAEALDRVVIDIAADLAPLFDGAAPTPGEGTEVAADEALATGPGDAVSVALDDAGTHRATVGLRMVISDELMGVGVLDPAYADEVDADQALVDAGYAGAADAGAVGQPLVDQPLGQPAGGYTDQPGPVGQAPVGQPPVAQAVPVAQAGAAPQPGRQRVVSEPVGEAHPADFASFDGLSSLPGSAHPMTMLSDVEMGVTAELGRTRLSVREVLALSPGSIIELDRAAGSPVDVVVNGTLIARGEVVVIDEEFGIRITEIMGMGADSARHPLRVAQ